MTCLTPGCGKHPYKKCPECVVVGIESLFCSQKCFNGYYPVHKLLHCARRSIVERKMCKMCRIRPSVVHLSVGFSLRHWQGPDILCRISFPDKRLCLKCAFFLEVHDFRKVVLTAKYNECLDLKDFHRLDDCTYGFDESRFLRVWTSTGWKTFRNGREVHVYHASSRYRQTLCSDIFIYEEFAFMDTQLSMKLFVEYMIGISHAKNLLLWTHSCP
jgi:hypothetical protein